MKRKIERVLFLIILLVVSLLFSSRVYANEINEIAKKSVALLDVPDSFDEVRNLNVSGFKLEVQLPNGETDVYDCSKIKFNINDSNSNKIEFQSDNLLIWLYSDDTITFVFKKYKNLSYNFVKNDFRYYNLKNDSKTYTYTSDYEIMNQNLFNINKEYPTKYDLRDKINVKVENQGGFGLCWDFAMTKALETTYAIKSQTSLDLSEMYVDYITNNKTGRGDRTLHTGGTQFNYYNETIRSGICTEDELPYNTESEYDINKVKNCNRVVLPQSAFWINESEISLNRNKEIVNKMIKEQLMNNGAVTIAITFAQNNFNSENNTFFLPTYCTQDNSVSHEVTIIGWDDNFSKEKFKKHADIYYDYTTEIQYTADIEPRENGAWIVLNSWGSEYGDNGVFYLSYESDIMSVFGFLDAIPYEDRTEYSYVDNEVVNYQTVKINENHKKYFYQEFNAKNNNENITQITIANVPRGKVYYIDNYEDRKDINFDNKVLIGDFASSISPVKYNIMTFHSGTDLLKTNFVLEEPIKINGNKFLIIVELDGDYVNNAYLNKNSKINTYYTDDELSSNWKKSTGDLPIGVFTSERIGGIIPPESLPTIWIVLTVIVISFLGLAIIFAKKDKKKKA